MFDFSNTNFYAKDKLNEYNQNSNYSDEYMK